MVVVSPVKVEFKLPLVNYWRADLRAPWDGFGAVSPAA